ncbi:probable LRR receptor-like serine/threonine-protein kinase At1g14390 [Macadamia integrifolia]|uniref:probable LRR receptor-like serine/threonine-protein kinase At1g14390 n=1 Tax=Macadamia integrifolia TaxID=60698 RepID=UPI001C4F07ED|nr:probable LRR receptor-like serine/threonine-protein kinase At1g14390 [Macadamia integrifolia]
MVVIAVILLWSYSLAGKRVPSLKTRAGFEFLLLKTMDLHRFCFLFPIFMLVLIPLHSSAHLSPSETRILFQVQELLEFPPALEGWNNWTNFCYLPPSQSLQIVCSGDHITQLTIVGNKSSPSLSSKPRGNFAVSQQTLSEAFSIDTFFTVLTKLSSLNVLSLVSLGLWGSLPHKITRFQSLEVLNMSSNFLYGEIPAGIATFKNLRSIVLADNLLNGTVPDLTSLIALEEVDLSYNLLGPKFPSLGNKLVSVVLRNNSFLSGISLEFKTFNQLQRLDISSNKLVGPIPSALFSLPSIQYLNLAMNRLSGALSRNVSCSHGLATVDLSHNLLTGRLPRCIGSNSSDLIVYYSWNCLASGSSKYQHPYSFCDNAALAVQPLTPNQQDSKPRTKLGLIVGIAVGAVVGLIAMAIVFLVIFKWAGVRSSSDNQFEKSRTGKPFFRGSSVLLTDTRHVTHAMMMGAFGLPPYHEFTLEEIEEATNNFDPANLMGQGSEGQLYKGWLREGTLVVVRCLKLKQWHSPQSLLQQMEVISKLRHRHLVGILGHCIVTYQDHPNVSNTIFLVLEYVSNGTLRSHLTDWRKRDMLKWPQRVAITVGVARGIQFLHTGITPGIFRNDIKIENILLDENLAAKISGYNLPLPVRVCSESASTGGEAPDRLGSVKYSEKDDVYHLGAILLEVITGKQVKSQDDVNVLKLQLEESLMDIPSKLRGATDPSMRGTFAYISLKTAVEITLNCLSKEPNQRPSIDDVLWNLQYSVQVQDGWTSSGKLSGSLSGKLSGFLGGRLSGSFNNQ